MTYRWRTPLKLTTSDLLELIAPVCFLPNKGNHNLWYFWVVAQVRERTLLRNEDYACSEVVPVHGILLGTLCVGLRHAVPLDSNV